MAKKGKSPGGNLDAHYDSVLGEISSVIEAARRSAARSVNCIMTAAYWLIGRRIVESEQKGEKRAAYGEELLERLSGILQTPSAGKWWTEYGIPISFYFLSR